jgi:hypothetical protein
MFCIFLFDGLTLNPLLPKYFQLRRKKIYLTQIVFIQKYIGGGKQSPTFLFVYLKGAVP